MGGKGTAAVRLLKFQVVWKLGKVGEIKQLFREPHM